MDKLLNPAILPFFVAVAVPLGTIITVFCFKIAKVHSDNELKNRLVERGFSADEIERIMRAGTEKDRR